MAYHDPNAVTQNQGNMIGMRPTIRQTLNFRQHESGNSVKALLGHESGHLQRNTGLSSQSSGQYETSSSSYGSPANQSKGITNNRALGRGSADGNVFLEEIERKKAQRAIDRQAAVEADRLDDQRVDRERAMLLREVQGEISAQRRREQVKHFNHFSTASNQKGSPTFSDCQGA